MATAIVAIMAKAATINTIGISVVSLMLSVRKSPPYTPTIITATHIAAMEKPAQPYLQLNLLMQTEKGWDIKFKLQRFQKEEEVLREFYDYNTYGWDDPSSDLNVMKTTLLLVLSDAKDGLASALGHGVFPGSCPTCPV